MAQSTLVCSNCGTETTHGDAMMNDAHGCEDGGDHDWSDDDPLSRLVARIKGDGGDMEVETYEDNDDWQWIQVRCGGRDPLGDSEGLANYVKREGFSFLGLGEGDNVVRFNRKK